MSSTCGHEGLDKELWAQQFLKKNQATTNITNKHFGIVFPICFLLIALSFLGYLSLSISSTIRDLKLKEMPKYKQVWPWHTDIFALCFWLSRNSMKICFRNISSTKLKWKECQRRNKHNFFLVLWLTQVRFQFQLPLTHFSSWCFLPIIAICLIS